LTLNLEQDELLRKIDFFEKENIFMEREMILFKKEITELKLSNSVLKESLK
jgi:hypothetical protein